MIDLQLHKTLRAAQGKISLDIQLNIKKGQMITLYGASGVGKTSIFRILSGLLKPDSGHIKVNDNTWLDTANKINLPPQERNIGFVFQEYTLFPNMTVRENLEFALRKGDDHSIIEELVEVTELNELQHQKSETLSGGQKQRVALARALVQQPKILLLDEPLSALDTSMRVKLQDYILKVHKRYQLTTILVSHDISEIIKMSDIVYCIDQGKVQKQGSPLEVFTDIKVDDNLKLIGELIVIQKENTSYKASILIGTNVMSVTVPEPEIKQFSIGETVFISIKNDHPKLYKVQS